MIQWRWILFFALLVCEYNLIISPSDPTGPTGKLLAAAFPSRVAYQHILVLHQLFIFMSVAVSRVAPVFLPSNSDDPSGLTSGVDINSIGHILDRIKLLVRAVDREVFTMLQTDLTSLQTSTSNASNISSRSVTPRPSDYEKISASPPSAFESLKEGMEELIIETKLRSEEGFLRTAWDHAVGRYTDRERQTERQMGEKTLSTSTGTPTECIAEERNTTSMSDQPSLSHRIMTHEGLLPSPRPTPSPPPSSSRYRPSYQRQRSVSLF